LRAPIDVFISAILHGSLLGNGKVKTLRATVCPPAAFSTRRAEAAALVTADSPNNKLLERAVGDKGPPRGNALNFVEQNGSVIVSLLAD